MPSTFTSFTSPTVYSSETAPASKQLNCAFLTGYTYSAPSLTSGAATTNPGNLFGWLIYARSILANPVRGYTNDSYIWYRNPASLISDLNLLGTCAGTNKVLINTPGNTHGFFTRTGTEIKLGPSGAADEFLYALDYLAYGGNLVLAGNTAGLASFIALSTLPVIDLIMGVCGAGVTSGNAFTNSQNWLKNESPYTIGIYPTTENGSGQTSGAIELANESFTEGATVADRVFVIYGQKTRAIPVSSLATNATLTYTHPLTPDIAGLFTRTNSQGTRYLSVAGRTRGVLRNGNLAYTIDWSDTINKEKFKNLRINYILNYTTQFLGSDLVGCTANSADIIVDERIGPAQMKTVMRRDITNLAMNYLFEVNTPTTRELLTTQILSYINQFSSVLDTTQTEVTCSSENNENYSTVLNIFVSVKPLASSTSFTLNIQLTQ